MDCTLEGYNELVLNPCVDNAQMDNNFASLSILIAEMVKGTSDAVCAPIDASNSGTFNTGETTTQILPAKPITSADAQTDACFFLGSIQAIRGSLAEDSIARVRYTIRCGNTIVQQGIAYSGGSISSLVAFGECKRGDEITVTTSLENQASETSETYRMEYQLNICGGRVCLENRDIRRAGAFVPCFPTGACCLGFEALALIAQNLNALGSAFSYGGKTIESRSITVLDNATVPIELNMPADATFIVFGATEVCFNNDVPLGTSVTVRPEVGCSGSDPAPCLLGTARPKGYSLKRLRTTCQRFPFATCGTCKKGEDLYAGQNPDVQCNAIQVDPEASIGYEIKTDLCVWLFIDAENEIETASYPPMCITQDYLTSLEDIAASIEQAACSRQPINETIRCVDLFNDTATVGDDTFFEIQEAIPFTPPISDPTATAPVKKWYVTGDVIATSDSYETNIEDTQWARITWTLTCGGVPLTDNNGDVITGSCPWVLASSGTTFLTSPRLDVVGNAQCATDQPLELLVNLTTPGSNRFTRPWTITGNLKAVCF